MEAQALTIELIREVIRSEIKAAITFAVAPLATREEMQKEFKKTNIRFN